MPDKWEYPWYAAWDLAFHMIPFARIDPDFAKEQLLLFLREWYMHPNGQIPAYEFAFGDVNPPVHAWAVWRVYKMTGPRGKRDRLFLERAFQKLLLNFTWWVNRKDPEGRNLFAGGFLGMDNVGVFDRSQPLPTGGHLEQADGTAWMAFYCNTMLSMALELASEDPAYEDLASKFFEHFIAIADAMNHLGGSGLWAEDEGFYYDQLHVDGQHIPLRVRSMVGVLPLIAVEVLDEETFAHLEGFKRRMSWFLANRTDVTRDIACMRPRDRDGTVAAAAGDPDARPAGADAALRAGRDRVPRAQRPSLGESGAPASSPTSSTSWGCPTGWTTSRRRGTPDCSAAIPTGADRSGSRSTSWSSRRWSDITTSTATSSRSNARSARARCSPCRKWRSSWSGGSRSLFLADGDGRRPCHGDESRVRVGSALEGPGPLPRVLRRRHRPRRRGEPPDRLDRARRALPRGHRSPPRGGRAPAGLAAPCRACGEPAMSGPIPVDDRTEWLEADGLGGFACGTTSGVRTRRYHALLLVATTPPTGRMVLVNGLDAWIERPGEPAEFLTRQRYAPDVTAPEDGAVLEGFTEEPWPTWSWRLRDGSVVEQELFVPRDTPLVAMRWRRSGAGRRWLAGGTTLPLGPGHPRAASRQS